MDHKKIQNFRKSLRSFERFLENQNKNSCCCNGVSLSQCHTLLTLEEMAPCSLVDLAGALGLDKSTVSRTIDGLVRIGQVNRELDPGNRRYMILSLTEQGVKTALSLNAENNRYYSDVLKTMTEQEIEIIFKGIELFQSALKNYDDDQSSPCDS